MATAAAALVSIGLLLIGSLFGIKMQELYTGKTEELIEGILMITSATFITWAVFFLHNYFGRYKTKLIHQIKKSVEQEEQKGLFVLVFTAVLREGFEIVLFLTTIYFSSNPQQIFAGFGLGAITGLIISLAFFTATLRMPIFYAFRFTSTMLILFAAGLLSRGVHEFAEVGFVPEIGKLTLHLIPTKTSFAGGIIKSVFGITQQMDLIQISLYTSYALFMFWWVFMRKSVRSA